MLHPMDGLLQDLLPRAEIKISMLSIWICSIPGILNMVVDLLLGGRIG